MPDISVKELERLYDEIDADINKNGLPTDEGLRAEIEELNETAPVKNGKFVDDYSLVVPEKFLKQSQKTQAIFNIMDKRILELALEALHGRMAAVDAVIQSIQTQLRGGAKPKTVAPAAGKRKARTAAHRKAQSEKMKKVWAQKRAQAAKAQATKKPAPAKQNRGPQSAAARKAVSERMKAYWAKRKAAKSKSGKKPA